MKICLILPITSASHAIPLPNGLCHLLCNVNAMAMEPLIAIITATVKGDTNKRNE